MAFDWLTISFDLHDNKITKKPPGGGREAKNQPPFWTGGLGRFRKFGGCRRTGGYGRLRGQWVKLQYSKYYSAIFSKIIYCNKNCHDKNYS